MYPVTHHSKNLKKSSLFLLRAGYDPLSPRLEVSHLDRSATKAWYNIKSQNVLNKLERQAADVLKTKSLLRSEQELRQKLDKLDPGSAWEMHTQTKLPKSSAAD